MRMEDRDFEFREKRRRRKPSSGISFDVIRDFVIDHYQYFGVGILFICLVIILCVFSNAVKDKTDDKKDKAEASAQGNYEVPDEELQVDAYDDVNKLVDEYFKATASGDTESLKKICPQLDEKEAIRIEQKAKYTDNYQNFTCYTKPGPEEKSYIVFAYYEIKFKNIDTLAPGLTSLYVKTDESGNLYVYGGDLSDEESEYIKAIAAQEDVVELLNTVDQKYNDAASSDETLKNFMDALPTILDGAVNAEVEKKESESEQSETAKEESDTLSNFTVKSTDNVNVRSGPSTDAEKLGQLLAGDTFTCIEAMSNGWSKIDFQGTEAYIKTEYIERVNEDGSTSPIEVAAPEGETTENEAPQSTSTSTKIKVNETVRVRAKANTDCDVLGQAEGGEVYELLGEENGFSKISYKGNTGYIRNDFVTKQ